MLSVSQAHTEAFGISDSSFCSSSKLFHVRPVTQGDVYRAETEEIPKIFQVRRNVLSLLFNPGKTSQLLCQVHPTHNAQQ